MEKWGDNEATQVHELTDKVMTDAKFKAFSVENDYLVSEAIRSESKGQLGKYRVKIVWAPCGDTTIVA